MKEKFKCPREGDLDELKEDVKSIMDNHLPSVNKAIGKLNTSIAWIKGALWVLVPVIIAGFGILIYLLRG